MSDELLRNPTHNGHLLVGALKRCRELDGELHVVVADPRIVKIFEITGLTNVFTIADSLQAAGAS